MHLLVVHPESRGLRFVEGIVREVVGRGGRVSFVTNEPSQVRIDLPSPREGRFEVMVRMPNSHWTWRCLARTRELKSYIHWLALDVQPEAALARWRLKVPGILGRIVCWLGRLGIERVLTARFLRSALDWLENVAPPGNTIVQQVADLRPEAALIMPLLYANSHETDYLKACRKLGIPAVAFVASWDNLSSKGTYQVKPDGVLVWNRTQVEEASRYHNIPPERVYPIGAPVFDDAFGRHWLIGRVEFCRRAGLDPTRQYFVYAVTSPVGWGDETSIVAAIARALREWPEGEQVQILVRPHPRNRIGWDSFSMGNVSVWPSPSFPDTAAAKADLYNTLFHSVGIVGLSTTMFLEAAILDRPGLTLRFRRPGQMRLSSGATLPGDYSTFLHFRYLLEGGFMEVVEDEKACARKMIDLLHGHNNKRAIRRSFVESFVRPAGWEIPSRRVAVDTLERFARAGAKVSEVKTPTILSEASDEIVSSLPVRGES